MRAMTSFLLLVLALQATTGLAQIPIGQAQSLARIASLIF